MSVVRLKDGAGFPVLAPAGVRILAAVDTACRSFGRDLTITSGSEGRGRKVTDPHMTGEALDLSVAGFTPGEIVRLKALLEADLGPLFTVLYETPSKPLDTALAAVAYVNRDATATHIHIQRKKQTVWPPAIAA
jgi:hypothetical protein